MNAINNKPRITYVVQNFGDMSHIYYISYTEEKLPNNMARSIPSFEYIGNVIADKDSSIVPFYASQRRVENPQFSPAFVEVGRFGTFEEAARYVVERYKASIVEGK